MAGFRELLAVEWDDNAVATFKLNFPDVPVYHGDIAKLSVEDALRLTGLRPGELDVFDGSPPCQGFSTAGKRQIDDPRNELFREYVRLLRGLRPRVFVMENVSGMVKGKMKLVFAEILRELKVSGYKVSARLMNAMYFNVPQSRERLIFVGVREDVGREPSHPKAEGMPFTVRAALAGCEVYKIAPALKGKQAEIASKIPPYGDGGDVTGGAWFGHKKLAWSKPARTINKEAWQFYHPDTSANFNIGELRRLHTFPDGFDFVGNWREASARIGNSVPPLFMRAIALHIRRHILT
jgi:DNA (cytosine-5)-methyltransferase 1